jgi:hypothetical protein
MNNYGMLIQDTMVSAIQIWLVHSKFGWVCPKIELKYGFSRAQIWLVQSKFYITLIGSDLSSWTLFNIYSFVEGQK